MARRAPKGSHVNKAGKVVTNKGRRDTKPQERQGRYPEPLSMRELKDMAIAQGDEPGGDFVFGPGEGGKQFMDQFDLWRYNNGGLDEESLRALISRGFLPKGSGTNDPTAVGVPPQSPPPSGGYPIPGMTPTPWTGGAQPPPAQTPPMTYPGGPGFESGFPPAPTEMPRPGPGPNAPNRNAPLGYHQNRAGDVTRNMGRRLRGARQPQTGLRGLARPNYF